MGAQLVRFLLISSEGRDTRAPISSSCMLDIEGMGLPPSIVRPEIEELRGGAQRQYWRPFGLSVLALLLKM